MASVVLGTLGRASALPAAFKRLALALVLVLCLPGTGAPQATPFNLRILGRWRGTSLCVKAAWNAACHDERVLYHFERAVQDSNRFALHAEKWAGEVLVPIGDLEFGFNEVANSWVAEFTNARVHVLWQYRVDGRQLTGRLVDLRSGRLLRNVTAVRDSA